MTDLCNDPPMTLTDLESERQVSEQSIEAWLDLATDADRAQGMGWYSTANTFAHGLADRYHITLDQAIAILAVVSPRTKWGPNQVAADDICRTGSSGIPLPANTAKALRILGGASILETLLPPRRNRRAKLRQGQGAKVRSFRACIRDFDTSRAVTIDYVSTAVANVDLRVLSTVGGYNGVADAYRAVADRRGLLPSQVQAISWVCWRRVNGADFDDASGIKAKNRLT